uniref:USP domain-containing protein n=1 Tax=Acrobeloides nanus TaxID=290746 RepID=A0A914C2F9_9BILA
MEPYTAQGIEARENLESPQPQDMFVSSDDDNITMQTDAMYPRDSTKLGSSSSQNSFNTRYRLRGVLVHSGQANGGHYYSFIRSSDENGRSDWFKFDDVDVSPWELNQETMRDCWFGGEYTAEWMINRRNRSKRCWNAYLLVFEKITSEVSSMPQQSSIVPSPPVITSPNSPNYQKMEKSFGSITLTSQRAMNKMPAQLEKLIRRKNLLSLHERSQYAHVYFGFITELSLHISHILREFREKGLVIDQRKKILGYVCSQLLTYFLLQTGLHAHHNLVRHYLLKWLDTLEEFMHIQEVRIWWFKQIILHRDITPLYLFDCPNSEVRIMCVRIISALLVLGRNDMTNLTENVPQEYGVNSSFFDPNDTITLGTLRILVTYIQNRYTEFLHRPNNYLQILLQYLGTSLEAKKHFLKLNFLNKFLFLFTDARTRDDQRIRLLAQEAPIIFTLISSMLRICRVNCDFEVCKKYFNLA